MSSVQLVELSRYFDDYMFGNRKKPDIQQAIYAFKATAREIYSLESAQLKEKYNLEQYISGLLIPEVAAELNRRQATHPVIVPEKRPLSA